MTAQNWQEQLRRGTLELAVLLAIAPEPRYGLEILRHLEFADLVLAEGTIYPLLGRLEREGLLASEWVEGEGPRPRKVLPAHADRSRPDEKDVRRVPRDCRRH